MLDLVLLRKSPDEVKAGLARRGVATSDLDELLAKDEEHRSLLQEAERLRARVKELSKRVGEARKSGDTKAAEALTSESRALGDEERRASEKSDAAGDQVRALLLALPNIPSEETPDGLSEDDNVEMRRWWPGMDTGAPFPTFEEYQKVPHWESGEALGILDLETGAKIAGSMFPLYRGDGSRLIRALSAYALDLHADAYEEIRPPTFALTDTMMSTGHLPKSADDMYEIPRDGLWAIPTSEVPLTSMKSNQILDEAELPIKMTAATACFRREAGAAGRDTRGVLRTHEFDKVELFAYCTPEQAQNCFDDILARAEAMLQSLGLTYRLLSLCAGDIGTSSKRTIDLEVFSPGVDRWLEVSSTSWFGDFQARRANVRFRRNGSPMFVNTVNGSALAWSRIWIALIETYRQMDGTIALPAVLSPYLGGRTIISKR